MTTGYNTMFMGFFIAVAVTPILISGQLGSVRIAVPTLFDKDPKTEGLGSSEQPFSHLHEAVLFNSETHVCCNANVFEKGKSSGCCGSKPFVASEALCCGERVFPFSELGEGPTRKYRCCISPDGSAKTYNKNTHECCDGVALERPDENASYGCCAGKLYDSASHICCDDKVHDKSDGNKCCGDKIYNTSVKMCCQRMKRKGDEVKREFADLHDLKGSESSCCGRAPYDRSKEVCCSDKILPKPEGIEHNDALCCEGRVVDKKHQLCCGNLNILSDTNLEPEGKAFDRNGQYSRCCGSVALDIRHQVCCNDTVIPKPAGIDENSWGTCCGDKIQTSFVTQICVNKRLLLERNSTDLWRCGDDGQLYNIHKQKCCYGEVLEKDGDTKCCHFDGIGKTYDKKKATCCEGGLVSLSDQDIKDGKVDCCE